MEQSTLESYSERFCPICAGRARPIFSKYSYPILGCSQCGHRFVGHRPSPEHLQQVYSDDYFQKGGVGYSNYLAEARLLRHHGQRYAQILKKYTSPRRVLDVGAAAGFILQGFVDQGWQGQGVEPNSRMAEYGRTHLGLQISVGSLEDLRVCSKFDLITMIQVIPHFFELQQALKTANRLTKPGGFWLVETWNRSSWTARMLGSQWHEYSPPSVRHWFSPKDLIILFKQYGFYKVAQGRPQKWINAAHGKSLLRYKLRDLGFIGFGASHCLRLIPDQLNFPYLADDLFWLLVQKGYS